MKVLKNSNNRVLTDGAHIYAGDFSEGVEISDKSYNFNNGAIKAFIDAVTYGSDYTTSAVDSYTLLPDCNSGSPVGIDVTLKSGTLRQYNAGKVNEEAVSQGTKTLYNVQPGSVNSYAVINDGKIVSFGNLVSTGNVRVIKGQTLKNIRDVGGWACDGGTVRYGLLYRGAELTGFSRPQQQMSTVDKNMLQNLLGIRAELDMRDASEDGGNASFDNVVAYLHQPVDNYESALNTNALKTAIEFLINKAIQGIPTIYHCVAGADRTGTLTWLLLGVLGVSQSDCDKEYEITSFSGPTRLRSGYLATLFASVNALSGADFTHKCLQALLDCGVSLALINQFRHAMIDGNPVDLQLNVQPIEYVVNDLKASTRMSYSVDTSGTLPSGSIPGNDNGGIALGVTTQNDYLFTDREGNTVYLMPIPTGCNHVAITTTDTSIVKYKFSAINISGTAYTRITNTSYTTDNTHQWAKGTANYICISAIYSEDGSIKPDWNYDSSKITVTFTN